VEAEAWRRRRDVASEKKSAEKNPRSKSIGGIWNILNQEMGYIDQDID
jgi:hypothetical protein